MEFAQREYEPELMDVRRLWNHTRRRHVIVSFGCSCGFPGAHVPMADVEENLFEFLQSRYHSEAGTDDGSPFADKTISGLLERLARMEPKPAFLRSLLNDLMRSIESFAPRGKFSAQSVEDMSARGKEAAW